MSSVADLQCLYLSYSCNIMIVILYEQEYILSPAKISITLLRICQDKHRGYDNTMVQFLIFRDYSSRSLPLKWANPGREVN